MTSNMLRGLLLIVCWTVGAWSNEMILITDVTIECQLRNDFEVTITVLELHEGGVSNIGNTETFHVVNKDVVLGLSGFVHSNGQDMELMYVLQHTCVSSPHDVSARLEVTKPKHLLVDYSPSTVTVSQGTWLLNGNRVFQKEDGELIGKEATIVKRRK